MRCFLHDQSSTLSLNNFDCYLCRTLLLSHQQGFALQVSTIAGWSFLFYRVWDASNVSSVLYFLLIIFTVPYILVNLFLAVLKLKFAVASQARASYCSEDELVRSWKAC
jgi:hypothetical protein